MYYGLFLPENLHHYSYDVYLQLVHMGEAMYLRKINGFSDGDDLGVKLLASKVT